MIEHVLGALPAATDEEMAAFRRATRDLYDLKERAFAAGDAEPIVQSFYAEDAVTVKPDGQSVEGRAAFREMYTRMVKDKTVRIESWKSYVRGNAGWDWTNFHVLPNDPANPGSTFVILFLWTKGERGWVCGGDMFVAGERAVGPAD